MKNIFIKTTLLTSFCLSSVWANNITILANTILVDEYIYMDKEELETIYKNYINKTYPQKVKQYELQKKEETVEVIELIGTDEDQIIEVNESPRIEYVEPKIQNNHQRAKTDSSQKEEQIDYQPEVVNIIRDYVRSVKVKPPKQYDRPPINTRPRPNKRPRPQPRPNRNFRR